jgi:glycosyltransferase involved in cell wall biosynthesis
MPNWRIGSRTAGSGEAPTKNMTARVCVVTAGHLSTCPRMLKAADALAGAGYDVRVVSTNHTPWAAVADRRVLATRTWGSSVVDYDRETARAAQLATGVRLHAARALSATVGASRVPLRVAIRAYSRVHDELVRAIAAEPADFVYGGTTGAMAAVAESAAQLRVPYGVDFEDLYSAEHAPAAEVTNVLAARIERQVISGAAFATAGSPMIADAYERAYGVRPIPVHNTFSIAEPPSVSEAEQRPLRLYWFSQTLGAGRGLEDVIRGIGKLDAAVELHLRARPIPSYVDALMSLQRVVAPRLTIVHLDPAPPDDMVRLAQPYDAGLACDEPLGLSRQLCLANKIFTYLAAGVPVVLSRTPAQAKLETLLGAAAFGYECGDIDGIAHVLRCLLDAEVRRQAQCAARSAAERRWHWEHPEDRGALVAAVAGAIR